MLTQSKLKDILFYNKEAGLFIWLISIGSVKKGSVAGSVNKVTGYNSILIKGRRYYAHRLAWLYAYGFWPEDQIDHINHEKLDNRIVNLRESTDSENHKNRSLNKNNTSGVCGVHLHKKDGKWYSQIVVNKNYIYLGSFDDFFDACCSRKSAEKKFNYHENHGK